MQWQWFLSAIALLLIFEGLGPFAAPAAWRRAVMQIAMLPTSSIRVVGAVLVAAGVALLLAVS